MRCAEIRDFHTHICRSDFSQMARRAEKMGLPFGVCEHVYQFEEVRRRYGGRFFLEGRTYSIAEYWAQLGAYRQSQRMFRIGTELDYLPDISGSIWQMLNGYPWDYIVGAVHEIDGWDIHDRRAFTARQREAVWDAYFTRQEELIRTYPVQILAHPIRMLVTVPAAEGMERGLRTLAAVAAEHNVALELNSRDWAQSHLQARLLIKCCLDCKCPVTLGSDAHFPRDIAKDFDRLIGLLEEERAVHLLRGETAECNTDG